MTQDREKQLEQIENRITAHTFHLIRVFQKLERLALEMDLSDVATESAQEIKALRSLIQPNKR